MNLTRVNEDHFDGNRNLTRGNVTPDGQNLAELMRATYDDLAAMGADPADLSSVSAMVGEQSIVFDIPGGVTDDYDFPIPTGVKLRVFGADVRFRAAGTAGDTLQLQHKNAAVINNISEALDISAAADKKELSFADVDDDYWELDGDASDELRLSAVDGGGADAPQCSVIVHCVRVA